MPIGNSLNHACNQKCFGVFFNHLQKDAAALNARESVAFADMTQLGDQISVNMPESIASLFQRQSEMHSAGKNESGGSDGQKEGSKSERPASDPAIPKPPSPITIPRAQISQGINTIKFNMKPGFLVAIVFVREPLQRKLHFSRVESFV